MARPGVKTRPAAAWLALLALLAGCGKKIRPEECAAMLDRYVELVVGADPALKNLPPSQASALREAKRAAKKAEASYARVQVRCESEVTRGEYECAMASKNADEWEACIE